jgi:hypothetical protein
LHKLPSAIPESNDSDGGLEIVHGPVIAFNMTIAITNAIAIMMSISSGLSFIVVLPLGCKLPSGDR